MKSYIPRRGLELVVLSPRWLSAVDDIEEDLLKDDQDELRVMMVHVDAIKSNISWLLKPWLLKGEAKSEYWRCVYDRWMEHRAKECAGIPVLPEPEIPPEAEAIIEEDKQFWNFKDDIAPDEEGDGSIHILKHESCLNGNCGEILAASTKYKYCLLN